MILGLAFTNHLLQPFWSFDTVPSLSAFAAVKEACTFLCDTSGLPSVGPDSDWCIYAIPADRLAAMPLPDAGSAEVTLVLGYISADVLCAVMAFVPSLDDVRRAVLGSAPSGNVPLSMQEVLHTGSCATEAAKATMEKGYVLWSGETVQMTPADLLAHGTTLAGRIHQFLGTTCDSRAFRGPEFPDGRV